MVLLCRLFDSPRRFFSSLGSMSDSGAQRAPGVLLSRRASGCQQHVTQTPSTLRAPRRKEVPRDFLKGKIEKFTMKLERAKSAEDVDEPRT